jgi:hypothetical protein
MRQEADRAHCRREGAEPLARDAVEQDRRHAHRDDRRESKSHLLGNSRQEPQHRRVEDEEQGRVEVGAARQALDEQRARQLACEDQGVQLVEPERTHHEQPQRGDDEGQREQPDDAEREQQRVAVGERAAARALGERLVGQVRRRLVPRRRRGRPGSIHGAILAASAPW